MAAPLTIGLFGPMRVFVGDEPLSRVRSRKALWLLALMTLRNGRTVSRDWVASTLWPDADQGVALSNLRPVICELRRAMGSEAYRLRSPDRVTLVLDLEGADVDLVAFDEAVAKGDYEQILAHYHGPLLEGCPEEWAPQERNSREQDCAKALQALGESALEAADFGQAIGHFQRLISLDPWRDAPRRGLMQALSKSGDVNAALQVYRDFAQYLRSEGGMVPDEKTTSLYTRIRNEVRQEGRKSSAEVQERPSKVVGHLPHALTTIVGREDERLEVAAKLHQHRLVTLSGPGGIGKTRLAMEVAGDVSNSFPQGVFLVSLENLRDERLLISHVMSSLRLGEGQSGPTAANLAQALRSKRLLLVLDNCEHLLDAVIRLTAHLLRECGDLKILTTSREALGILGEKLYPVPALAFPDPEHLPSGQATLLRVLMSYESVRLFVERTQAVTSSFSLNRENALDIARICARLDGLPLAIELAAARAKAMTPGQLADRLGDHLRLLTGGSRSAASRQQTLRATLDWSYDMLGPTERRLLKRLSVFSGGWTLEAAEKVCSDESLETEEVLDAHRNLVDKSMVGFNEKAGRFRLLETVKQYATEKLREAGEMVANDRRHREWCLAFAEEAESQLRGSEKEHWLAQLDAESSNLQVALMGSDVAPKEGLRLAGSLWRFWYLRGRYSEGREAIGQALSRQVADEPESMRKALYGAGCLAYSQSDMVTAKVLLLESLALAKELSCTDGIAQALNVLGNVATTQNDYDAANSYYEESLALQRGLGIKANIALGLYNLGTLLVPQYELREADRRFEEALGLYRELGDKWGTGLCLYGLGVCSMYRGEYDLCRSLYEETLQLGRELQDQRAISFSLFGMAWTALEQGHLLQAEALAEESAHGLRQIGDQLHLASLMIVQGSIAFEQDDLERSWSMYEEAYQLTEAGGFQHARGRVILNQGATAYRRGDLSLAQNLWTRSLSEQFSTRDRDGIASSLVGLSVLACREGAYERSCQLFGASEAVRDAVGVPAFSRLRVDSSECQRINRSELGETRFSILYDEGRNLAWSEVEALAVRKTAPSLEYVA